MKHTFFTVLSFYFLVSFHLCDAQIVSKTYSSAVMQAFIKGQTYAVLTTDDTFNKWFQSTLEKQWTVNPIQFISAAKLDSVVISDKNFILFPQSKDEKTAAVRLLTGDDLAKKKEFFIVLSQGGYKTSKLLFAAGATGSKVLGSFRYGPDRAELGAGMLESEIMLSLLNQSLQAVIDKKIRSVVKDSVKWVITDENVGRLRDQTLLINRSYYDGTIAHEEKPLVSEKVLEDYPYEYLVVSKDSVQLLFDESSGDYSYLFLYFPTVRFKTEDDSGDIIVYDPFLKRVLYYEDNMSGPWFEKWKLKQLIALVKSNKN